MRKFLYCYIFAILVVAAHSQVFAAQPAVQLDFNQTLSPEELNRRAIQYQIEISSKVADQLRLIFTDFNNSFIDYEPALKKMHLLTYEYERAMKEMPVAIPPDGQKLHQLTLSLLSKIEQYFVFYKMAGMGNPDVNIQITRVLYDITAEREMLIQKYLL
ncbi:MAG: hypothetical protein PHW46_03465 [Candidatus Omnitrophica bacterium]|nr:hypothetical protein [Candidatus Omnitrophota bacterium]